MLWIFAERFFMAALRQCEKSEGCFAVFTAQPWTAAVLFKLQFSDGLLDNLSEKRTHARISSHPSLLVCGSYNIVDNPYHCRLGLGPNASCAKRLRTYSLSKIERASPHTPHGPVLGAQRVSSHVERAGI